MLQVCGLSSSDWNSILQKPYYESCDFHQTVEDVLYEECYGARLAKRALRTC